MCGSRRIRVIESGARKSVISYYEKELVTMYPLCLHKCVHGISSRWSVLALKFFGLYILGPWTLSYFLFAQHVNTNFIPPELNILARHQIDQWRPAAKMLVILLFFCSSLKIHLRILPLSIVG